MKNKIVKVLQNKRARYLLVSFVLVLFCLALNIAFSAFTSNAGGVAANLNVKNMTYSVKLNGTSGTIIKANKNGLTKVNTTFTATNDRSSKYELSYDVCSNSTCSSTITKPSTLTVQYSSRSTDGHTGSIAATGTVNIRVVITNTASSDVYIRLRMNAGFTHNTLNLEKKVTGPYNEDDLTVYSYINGTKKDAFPTSSNYGASVKCQIDGGGTSNASGSASWDGSKWNVNITGVDTGRTVCNVYFVPEINIAYSGAEVTRTIDEAGTYRITVTGAAGTQGNKYGYTSSTLAAGKGAQIYGDFTFAKGDVLYINVGGMGSSTTGTSIDGASGAGGGGTFIFKKVSSVSNSNIQFTKNSAYYEVLIVAAGGGGTGDIGYKNNDSSAAGKNGIAITYYSSSNYTSYSTTTTPGTSSSAVSNVLGISQWISYNLKGATYARGSSKCTGGFGGGGCQDDNPSYGGGWSGSSYTTYSFCNGTNCTGTDGVQTSNGTFKMVKIS